MGKWVATFGMVALGLAGLAGLVLPRPASRSSPPTPGHISAASSETEEPVPALLDSTKRPAVSRSESEPRIRVNLTPGGTPQFTLRICGGFRVRSLTAGLDQEFPRGFSGSVQPGSGTGIRIGENSFDNLPLEVVPDRSPDLEINGALYRGTLRIFRRTDQRLSAVNVLPLEAYLASVVDSEMPASFPAAARQTQAIVSRTYALYHHQQAAQSPFDVFATERSQRYLGVEYPQGNRRLAGESSSSRSAVNATRSQVLTLEGRLFCAYFSAACGGSTSPGRDHFKDADHLTPVPCEWCRDCPHYRWTNRIRLEDVQQQIPVLKPLSQIQSIEPHLARDGLSRFCFSDGKQSVTLTNLELRSRLKPATFRSPRFDLRLEEQTIVAHGRGHGHGVGMCQWGARGLALHGKRCEEILQHYYPGSILQAGY